MLIELSVIREPVANVFPACAKSVRIAARGSEEELSGVTGRLQGGRRQSGQRSTTAVDLEEVTMGTVLELGSSKCSAWIPCSAGTVLVRTEPAAAVSETAWLTATIRPAGTFGRNDTGRLRALLDALSDCASIVVLDLQAARLRSPGAGEVIEDAACDIEGRGGCLLCINVDSESRACLSAAGDHAVLMDEATRLVAPRVTAGRQPEGLETQRALGRGDRQFRL